MAQNNNSNTNESKQHIISITNLISFKLDNPTHQLIKKASTVPVFYESDDDYDDEEDDNGVEFGTVPVPAQQQASKSNVTKEAAREVEDSKTAASGG